jgi:predicted nucleic acid-binding protein
MKVFLDSSSLAKRYIMEAGSDIVDAILSEAREVAVSLIAPPEIISALNRLRRHNLISALQYGRAKKALFKDIEDMSICNMTVPVVEKAIGLIEVYPLKTLDALHVACALEWRPDLFVSSDRRQVFAARKMGLRIRFV